MVAMEIMHFYIVQLIFEGTSILHYMGSNLIPTKKKKKKKKKSPGMQEV